MDHTLRETVKNNRRKRGLAVIIYNSYEDTRNYLSGTIKDGEAMKDAFDSLDFATIPLHDVTKANVEGIIRALATYSDYPEGYDCFAIYFAGHGDKNSTLVAIDEDFDFERVIVQRLNQKNHSDVAEHITKVTILAFIDACRGEKDPRVGRIRDEDLAPENMMVAYATREKFKALEDPRGGGIWTQKLARALRSSNKSVRDILDDVKDQMPSNYKKEALPVTWNARAGNIKLTKLAGGGSRGADSTQESGNTSGGSATGQNWKVGHADQVIVVQQGGVHGGIGGVGIPGPGSSAGRGSDQAARGSKQGLNIARCITVIRYGDSSYDLKSKVSSKWKSFGLQLSIDHDTLETWWSETRSASDCFDRVMNAWFGGKGSDQYPVGWDGLYMLLEDKSLGQVAKDLKYAVDHA